MKKLVFLLVCVFTVSTVAMADNEKPFGLVCHSE
jgi:hypothetical protein